jgi:DNA polymerase III delta prime subunit
VINKFFEKRRSNQGIIVYGQDGERNLAMAYEVVINHVIGDGASTDLVEYARRHILANTYPNFMRIDVSPEKNDISINETREIICFLSQKPALPGGMAVIVDHAEKMSKSASNSILKTLEELPINSMIVMTTSRLPTILPTIRSRCIKVYAKSQRPSAFECSDVSDYIERHIPNLEKEYIHDIINLITSGYNGIVNFAKQNAETAEDFLNVLSAYYAYLSIKTEDYAAAEKTLKLQSLAFQLKTAFPDRQNTIIAASITCSS